MKKKLDKASLLTTGVVVILCIFFVGGFIIGLNMVLDMEGNYPPAVNEEGLTPAPEAAGDALDFLNKSIAKAGEDRPKIQTNSRFGIDGDSIETDCSEQFRQACLFVKGNVEDCLAQSVGKPSCDFYEDNGKVIQAPAISPSQIEDFTCDYIYYQCPSCGVTSDEPLEECEPCGGERAYQMKYSDNYRVSLTLTPSDAALDACFGQKDKADYLAVVNEALGDKAKITGADVEYTGLTVYYEINRLTDKITYLRYSREMTVSFDASGAFTGEWAKYEGGSVSFTLSESFDYSFTWPALTLSAHVMSVEPKGSDNLLATLTCDDPTAYDVTWKSSDESIVTVDNEGYFDAGKKTGKATITASYEFGGITYSDECEVNVKVSIERLSMHPKKVKLPVGAEQKLTVKFKPAKATIQTLTWYSEDESIATVDKDGTVRAVAPGKVTVYCLSDDDYFKSTCEVTVQ